MAGPRLAELRPYLRRVATALAGIAHDDREELVQMLELGALVREARTVLIREIEDGEPEEEEE